MSTATPKREYKAPKLRNIEPGSINAASYRQQLENRLAGLKSKLQARERATGTAYVGNTVRLEEEIAKLERVLAALDNPANIAEG